MGTCDRGHHLRHGDPLSSTEAPNYEVLDQRIRTEPGKVLIMVYQKMYATMAVFHHFSGRNSCRGNAVIGPASLKLWQVSGHVPDLSPLDCCCRTRYESPAYVDLALNTYSHKVIYVYAYITTECFVTTITVDQNGGRKLGPKCNNEQQK